MISTKMYKQYLSSKGNTLGAIRKNQSIDVIEKTFTGDPTYKRVYVLTKNGWQFVDAKYQFHTASSIVKDDVDYYLQFRHGQHFPIGSYVIVPDETNSEINLTKEELTNPFLQPVSNRTQWWMIVGKDNANAFVRYNILQCNWNFQWIYDGKICNCFGAVRSANSYTSGKWTDEISSALDNMIGAWLPDIHFVYGDNMEKLGLDDVHTIFHEQRFILGHNQISPLVYQVTKIIDLFPQGIIKYSFKQDEFNTKLDNKKLGICNYYTDNGNLIVHPQENTKPTLGILTPLFVNEFGEFEENSTDTQITLSLGKLSYFKLVTKEDIDPEWHVELEDKILFSEQDQLYYEGLMKITELSSNIVSIQPKKAESLKGKKFTISVSDKQGNYYSSLSGIEVI